jgi:lipoate---protein ligase
MDFLDLTLDSIAADLALEEALLQSLDSMENSPRLMRVWEPNKPAVILGASGRIREEVDLETCNADQVPIARRSSGGGTVVVGPGALNISLFFPLNASPSLRSVETAQLWVMNRIAGAIHLLGRPVELRGLGDLALGDRKVAGSAQRRLRSSVLVHATVMYDFPLELIGRFLRLPRKQPEYRRGRNHDAFVTNLGLERHALIRAIRDEWTTISSPVSPFQVPWNLALDLEGERFANQTWIHRF